MSNKAKMRDAAERAAASGSGSLNTPSVGNA